MTDQISGPLWVLKQNEGLLPQAKEKPLKPRFAQKLTAPKFHLDIERLHTIPQENERVPTPSILYYSDF
ncbi:MAG: hypothetical protein KIIPBIDF_01047 [Candidatus Methanoperedenaceae archaeon GB50]|nr:MAG: hypothetical protein KIIPBIDF_01047 [Candidatus Methanoperedenaceae archaeon GB50]